MWQYRTVWGLSVRLRPCPHLYRCRGNIFLHASTDADFFKSLFSVYLCGRVSSVWQKITCSCAWNNNSDRLLVCLRSVSTARCQFTVCTCYQFVCSKCSSLVFDESSTLLPQTGFACFLSIWKRFCVLVCIEIFCKTRVVWTELFSNIRGKYPFEQYVWTRPQSVNPHAGLRRGLIRQNEWKYLWGGIMAAQLSLKVLVVEFSKYLI